MDETDVFFLSAFDKLSTERQIGAMGGVGFIPYSKIVDFVERAGLDGDVAEASATIIHELDKGYVASVNKQ